MTESFHKTVAPGTVALPAQRRSGFTNAEAGHVAQTFGRDSKRVSRYRHYTEWRHNYRYRNLCSTEYDVLCRHGHTYGRRT